MWVNQLLMLSLLGASPVGTQPATMPAAPRITRFELDNGLKVSLITIENEMAISMFTFMPGGLVADEPGHPLWSRLIERLSTQLAGESDGHASADHLRLESWSRPEKWEATLSEHARLLKGADFNEHDLKMYREDAIAWARWVEKDFQAWDLALAFFGQAVCHGQTDIPFRKRINEAVLSDVQAYRQKRWGIMPGTRLCVISRIAPATLKDQITKLFGPISSCRGEAVTSSVKLHLASSTVTWDSDHSFVALGWPLPTLTVDDRAALLMARNLLERQWLKGHDQMYTAFGWNYPGIASLPEGDFFMLPVCVGGETSSIEEARKWGMEQVRLLQQNGEVYSRFEEAREAVSAQLLLFEVPRVLNREKSDDRSDLFDRWLGFRRTWAEIEWRYADKRGELGQDARTVTAERIREIARKYLSERDCIVCTIVPSESSDRPASLKRRNGPVSVPSGT